MDKTILHPSILALTSLAAHVAANHPGLGLCQIDKLKHYGVSKDQIDLVVEIARHIREEAAMKTEASFDTAYQACWQSQENTPADTENESGACCTPAATGKSCC